MGEHEKPERPRVEFPLWFQMAVVAIFLGMLAFNVYRGGDLSLSLMFAGIVGAAMRFVRDPRGGGS